LSDKAAETANSDRALRALHLHARTRQGDGKSRGSSDPVVPPQLPVLGVGHCCMHSRRRRRRQPPAAHVGKTTPARLSGCGHGAPASRWPGLRTAAAFVLQLAPTDPPSSSGSIAGGVVLEVAWGHLEIEHALTCTDFLCSVADAACHNTHNIYNRSKQTKNVPTETSAGARKSARQMQTWQRMAGSAQKKPGAWDHIF